MSSDWYARKLNVNSQPVQPSPTPPVAPPAPSPFNPPTQVPQEPPRLPQSAVNASKCPGCGSGNYGSVTPESKARCYDCGYPIQQSGSGVGTGITQPGGSGPAQPARQISTANNFNPQGIIGRIE